MINFGLFNFKKALSGFLLWLRRLLLLLLIAAFYFLLLIKWKVYGVKMKIESVEQEIAETEEEIKILDAELAYLTTPGRLKMLYGRLNNCDDCHRLLTLEQIKTISDLLPYYYARYNNKNTNSLAMNESKR